MSLLPTLTYFLVLVLQLHSVLCLSIYSEDIVARASRASDSTSFSNNTGPLLNTTTNGYRDEWPIHHTSMVLFMRRESSIAVKMSLAYVLLNEIATIADANDPSEILDSVFEYELDANGPRFAIGPPVSWKKLTWGDVSRIVGGLVQYLVDVLGNRKWCPALSFRIGDTKRGGIGFGMVTKAKKIIDNASEGDINITATS